MFNLADSNWKTSENDSMTVAPEVKPFSFEVSSYNNNNIAS